MTTMDALVVVEHRIRRAIEIEEPNALGVVRKMVEEEGIASLGEQEQVVSVRLVPRVQGGNKK